MISQLIEKYQYLAKDNQSIVTIIFQAKIVINAKYLQISASQKIIYAIFVSHSSLCTEYFVEMVLLVEKTRHLKPSSSA